MDWNATITKVSAQNGLLKVSADFTPAQSGKVETAVLTYRHWLAAPEIQKPDASASESLNLAAWSLDSSIRKLWRERNPAASENLKVEKPDGYPPGFFRLSIGNSLSSGETEAVYQVKPEPKSRREQEIRRYLSSPFNPYNPVPDPNRTVEVVKLRRFVHFDESGPRGMPVIDPVRLLSHKRDQLAHEAVWQGVRTFSVENLVGQRAEIDLENPYTGRSMTPPAERSPAVNSKSEETTISAAPPQANTRPRSIVPSPPQRPAFIDGFHHGH